MCVGVEYLTFDILSQAKSEQKLIFHQEIYLLQFISGLFGFYIIYFFLFEKPAFNGLLKLSGIQRLLSLINKNRIIHKMF